MEERRVTVQCRATQGHRASSTYQMLLFWCGHVRDTVLPCYRAAAAGSKTSHCAQRDVPCPTIVILPLLPHPVLRPSQKTIREERGQCSRQPSNSLRHYVDLASFLSLVFRLF
jgi:hypothetical protein